MRFYLAADGDDIGSRLEYLMLTNDVEALSKFSSEFRVSLNRLATTLIEECGAAIVFEGGDNFLALIDGSAANLVAFNRLREEFAGYGRCTMSFGGGKSPREAFLALKFAKVCGKNCMKSFEDLVCEPVLEK